MPLILVLASLAPMAAYAYTGITIVMSSSTSVNQAFVAKVKEALIAQKAQTIKVSVVDMSEASKLVVAENSELVIALGIKAMEASSKLRRTTPVLGVFVPLPAFNRQLYRSGRNLGELSAIVLDQPYRRQVALARIALPEAKSLGILLGTTSSRHEDFLRESAVKHRFTVDIENINEEAQLIPKLAQICEANDALLAIPDPLVYNRETAQPILLTSYRHQVPVFGYSKSYVKAGALAAVFSHTKHLAKQAVEIAVKSQKSGNLLPPPQVPKYFSVIVNRQVERSLGLELGDEHAIYQKMLALESKQPSGAFE